MKKLANSRAAASVFLVLSVLLSVFLGVHRSIGKLENKAFEAYFEDDPRYGAAYEDMKKFGQYALMLNSIAESNGADSGFSEAVGLFNGHSAEPYISDKDYENLFMLAAASYNGIIADESAETQQKISAKQYFYEMNSTYDRLSNNKYYNSLANKYNKAVSSFPASLLMPGADRMIVFD